MKFRSEITTIQVDGTDREHRNVYATAPDLNVLEAFPTEHSTCALARAEHHLTTRV